MATTDHREDQARSLAPADDLNDPNDATTFGDRFRSYLADKRRPFYTRVNRASDLGFPCDRYSVLRRLAPNEAALPTTSLQGIFEFGRDYENNLRRHLWEGAGYRFQKEQETLEWEHFQIEGTPEGLISADDGATWHLFEIKGLHPYHWQTIETWRDFLASPIYSRYVAQGQIYMLLRNRKGERREFTRILYILGRKGTYDLRWLWMPLDLELAESFLAKAERINAHVAAKTRPDRITDRRVCNVCDFKGSCLPDRDYGDGAEFMTDPDLLHDLDERDRLAAAAREYESLDKRIKARVQGRPLVVCGPYALEGKERTRTEPPRPGGIVKYWLTTIRRLGANS